MRLEKVGAEYKRKFNLGNYESAEIGAIIWAKKHTPDYTESFTKYGQKVDKSELESEQ